MSRLRVIALLILAASVLSLVILNEKKDGKAGQTEKPSPNTTTKVDGLTDLPPGTSWHEVLPGQTITLSLPLMGIQNVTPNKQIVLESVELGEMTHGLSFIGSVVIPIQFADSGLNSHYNDFPPAEFSGHTYNLNGFQLDPGNVVHILLGFEIKDYKVNRFNGITLVYTLDGAQVKKFYDFKTCFYPDILQNICIPTNSS